MLPFPKSAQLEQFSHVQQTALSHCCTIPLVRITAIDTYIAGNPWKNWVFTKVSTDEGIHGVGEGTLNGFGKPVEAAIHELKPLAIGMDPFQVETISQRLVRDVYSEGAQIHMCAVAAIEIEIGR